MRIIRAIEVVPRSTASVAKVCGATSTAFSICHNFVRVCIAKVFPYDGDDVATNSAKKFLYFPIALKNVKYHRFRKRTRGVRFICYKS